MPRKPTCGSSFCNFGSCENQISVELGYTREIYLEKLRRTILQKSAFKVTNRGQPPRILAAYYKWTPTLRISRKSF